MKSFKAQDNSLVLRGLLENPDLTIDVLCESVKGDPKMSAFVLKVANNPFFGIDRKIDDIGLAIELLGIGQVIEMLMEEFAASPLHTSVYSPKKNTAFFSQKIELGITRLAIM